MFKIALTGGPCGGKRSALPIVSNEPEKIGYKVLSIPEIATQAVMSGFVPNEDNISLNEFECRLFQMQIATENIYSEIAASYDTETIILLDRGLPDIASYVESNIYQSFLEEFNLTMDDVYAYYDLVIHMTTTAKANDEHYQWNDPDSKVSGNNIARRENPHEARVQDDKILQAWKGHPNLHIVGNYPVFEEKISNIINIIHEALS